MSQGQADKKSFQRRRRRRRMGERGAGERKEKGEAVSQTICLADCEEKEKKDSEKVKGERKIGERRPKRPNQKRGAS